MFNPSHPPLLVQPIRMGHMHSTLFPYHEGYCVNYLDEVQALISYKDGWTFPLSSQQHRFVSEPPQLMVKNAGGITSASSTVTKGYAHQFCEEDGTELVNQRWEAVFPDQPEIKWMLIPNSITMIWLQFGNKNQYCGQYGSDIERIYYGKLLIRKFSIEEDFSPRLGKDAADPFLSAKQYRVHSHQVYHEDWSITDQDANSYICKLLTHHNLERYQTAVLIALKRAGCPD